MPKLLNRTHFEKKYSEKTGQWQWYWRTEAPNGEPVGVGGEGYHDLTKAINGFLSQQGIPGWEGGRARVPMPEGYTRQKFDSQHYVITHHGEE